MNDKMRGGRGQQKASRRANTHHERADRDIISLFTGRCRHSEENDKHGQKIKLQKKAERRFERVGVGETGRLWELGCEIEMEGVACEKSQSRSGESRSRIVRGQVG